MMVLTKLKPSAGNVAQMTFSVLDRKENVVEKTSYQHFLIFQQRLQKPSQDLLKLGTVW